MANPKDFPFNYVVSLDSEIPAKVRQEEASNLDEAKRIVTDAYPRAVFDDSFDDLHYLSCWPDADTRGDPASVDVAEAYENRCAVIERHRDAYEKAQQHEDVEKAFEVGTIVSREPSDSDPGDAECGHCHMEFDVNPDQGVEYQCEDCGKIFCSGDCEKSHGAECQPVR